MAHCHNSDIVTAIYPSAVFIASLLGSWHCLAMCGGLVMACAKSKTELTAYHIARGVSYCLVGVLATVAGSQILSILPTQLSLIAGALFGLYFIYYGVTLLRDSNSQSNISIPLVNQLFSHLLKVKHKHFAASLVGFFSVLLPCGWLYSYIILAMSTKSAALALMVMVTFWLGSLPIFIVSPWVIQKVKIKRQEFLKKITALLFMLIGVLTIALRIV